MKKLSNYQKAKIALQIINSLNELPNKGIFYIRCEKGDTLVEKIAKRAKIYISNYTGEAGNIDIREYIDLTFDEIEDRMTRKLNGNPTRVQNHSVRMFPEFKVSDALKELTNKFEKENIPDSGPCKTLIGEMFRAIQYIQYRAHNDGDLWFIIGSPSFMSYMFLISQIDELNWSPGSYNNETDQHLFEFTDPFLKENSWDNRISWMIEHSLALDADFIKYQLIDLLSNGKIKDKDNEYDSRSFTKLKSERDY